MIVPEIRVRRWGGRLSSQAASVGQRYHQVSALKADPPELSVFTSFRIDNPRLLDPGNSVGGYY